MSNPEKNLETFIADTDGNVPVYFRDLTDEERETLESIMAEERAYYAAKGEAADVPPLTESEREAMEAYMRREKSEAAKEYAQDNRDLRQEYLASGLDIRDFALSICPDGAPEDLEAIARRCGFRQTTWDDGRNVTRRHKVRETNFKRASQAADFERVMQKAEGEAAKSGETPTAPKAKPAKSEPATAKDPRPYITRIAELYNRAITKHPARAAKLEGSLKFQLNQLDATIAHHTGKGKTWEQAAALWEDGARRACEAKLR